ncbi:MAG: hypothetical protein V3V05_10365, partial [Pontiella sp.]
MAETKKKKQFFAKHAKSSAAMISLAVHGVVDCKLKCPVWKSSAPCQNEPFFNSPQTRIGASAWSKRKVAP